METESRGSTEAGKGRAMNTTELIEIARECCFSRQVVGDETVLITFRSEQLQQFAQRIEAPHKQRIAELEKTCNILATNYDAARRASWFTADVADQALADLKAAEKQIEQLLEALQALYDEQNGPPLIRDASRWEAAMELASNALEGK